MKKSIKRILLALLLSPIVLLLAIIIRAFLKEPLTSEIRKDAGGSYVELRHGVVHYDLTVNSLHGPTAVLIHGITVPMIVWNKTITSLHENGINTLVMDLYGRGYSDRPKTKYNAQLYIQQITELLDSLHINAPVHLIGISMGGAVAANVANAAPHRVSSVTLIDPAITYRKEYGIACTINRLKNGITAVLKMKKNSESDEKKHLADFTPHIREQLRYRGVEFSLLSMALYGKSEEFIEAYRLLGKKDIPIQIIWGERDEIMPLTLGQRLASELPYAQFYTIPHSGHTPQYEKPELVNPILVNFIETQYNTKTTNQ